MTTTISRTEPTAPPTLIAAAPATSALWAICLPAGAHAVAPVSNLVVDTANVARVRMSAAPSKAEFSAAPAGIGNYAGRKQGTPPRGQPR